MSEADSNAGAQETPHRRCRSRLRVRLAAKVITLDAEQSGVLVDISLHGARITTGRDALRVGREVVIEWGPFEAFGKVVWSHGMTAGIEFFDQLPPKVLLASRDLDDDAHLPEEQELNRQNARQWVEGARRL